MRQVGERARVSAVWRRHGRAEQDPEGEAMTTQEIEVGEVTELREGDVFRFSYHEEVRAGMFMPYHCFDGQLVVRNGRLCDTYWGFDSGEPRTFTLAEALAQGLLRFVVNLGDVTEIREGDQFLYDEADVFDLTHHAGYRRRFMLRKGAERSQARMLREVDDRIRKARAEAESAVSHVMHQMEHLGKAKARIEAGDIHGYIGW